jgi:hypothetical protein
LDLIPHQYLAVPLLPEYLPAVEDPAEQAVEQSGFQEVMAASASKLQA